MNARPNAWLRQADNDPLGRLKQNGLDTRALEALL